VNKGTPTILSLPHYDFERIIRDKDTIHILPQPTGSGKTTFITKAVDYAVNKGFRPVYVVPEYTHAHQFQKYLKYRNHKLKIAIIKGRRRYNSYNEWRNSFEDAKASDVIISTVPCLYELWQKYNLPYDPINSVLFLDEGELILSFLKPDALKLCEFEDAIGWRWTNIRSELITQLRNLNGYKYKYPKIIEKVDNIFNILNPNNFIVDIISGWNAYSTLNKYKEEIQEKLKKESSELFTFLSTHYFYLYEDLRAVGAFDVISSLNTLAFVKEIRIINPLRTSKTEVWIVPEPCPLMNLDFFKEHPRIILSSGSLTNREVMCASAFLGIKKVRMVKIKTRKYPNVMVIVSPYNLKTLLEKLNSENYTVLVTHSSFRRANEISKRLGINYATPKNIKEYNEALTNGVKFINIVQNSGLALNQRLKSDIAVVGTAISKRVELYGSRKLYEKCILAETYQALSRILPEGNENRVIVILPQYYDIIKDKFRESGFVVVNVSNEDEIVEEIKKWIKVPTKPSKKLKVEKFVNIRYKRVKGREYAIVEFTLPKEFVDRKIKRVKVTVTE